MNGGHRSTAHCHLDIRGLDALSRTVPPAQLSSRDDPFARHAPHISKNPDVGEAVRPVRTSEGYAAQRPRLIGRTEPRSSNSCGSL